MQTGKFSCIKMYASKLDTNVFCSAFSTGYPSNSVVILFVSEDTPECPVFY